MVMKICIAASAGGHLTEALQLSSVWKGKPHFFITDKRINALELEKKEKVYFVSSARRNPLKLIAGFLQTVRVFAKEKPDIVISTGADTAFPAVLLGALFCKRTIYIETFARTQSPSLFGRAVYPFIKDFYVQWPEGKKFFPRAKYVGSVFE